MREMATASKRRRGEDGQHYAVPSGYPSHNPNHHHHNNHNYPHGHGHGHELALPHPQTQAHHPQSQSLPPPHPHAPTHAPMDVYSHPEYPPPQVSPVHPQTPFTAPMYPTASYLHSHSAGPTRSPSDPASVAVPPLRSPSHNTGQQTPILPPHKSDGPSELAMGDIPSTSQESPNQGSYAIPHGGSGSNSAMDAGLRKRSNRAQQACESCRSRKAKCDEGRPSCTFCKENGMECKYRDVPPPKSDRQLNDLMKINEDIKAELKEMKEMMMNPDLILKKKKPSLPPPAEAVLDDGPSFSIPTDHVTAAHKLFRWEAMVPVLRNSNIQENYVMEGEINRGALRLFGYGEGAYVDDQDSKWGSEAHLDEKMLSDWSFDPNTMNELNSYVDTYFKKINVMHPILNETYTKNRARAFIMKYVLGNPGSPKIVKGAVAAAGSDQKLEKSETAKKQSNKRKRNPVQIRTQIDRTIDTALMLLVFALGKICQHTNWLGGPAPDPEQAPIASSQGEMSSAKPSPESQASPAAGGFAAPTTAGATPAPKRNFEAIPGLSYYTMAAQILNETLSCNELTRVQAGLLAGLYCGQLARAIDSYKWISNASKDCYMIVIRLLKPVSATDSTLLLERLSPQECLLMMVNYWTCLQLESDLLAELDVLSSGIEKLESTLKDPQFGEIQNMNNQEQTVWLFYLAQLHMRKLLNATHSTLYRSMDQHMQQVLNINRELRRSIATWRTNLLPPLAWRDGDPLPTDINAARLRAKFYGAKYIINRPVLYHALHTPHTPEDLARWGVSWNEIIDICRDCIESAISSTRAFHGMEGRLMVTNVFGTAHAQFGNCLVLQAVAHCEIKELRNMVQPEVLSELLDKTIAFLSNLEPISPTMAADAKILIESRKTLDDRATLH